MTFQGVVQNGVVVLQPGTQLPEGAAVSVTVTSQPPRAERDRMSEEHRQQLLAALDAIAALPIEGSVDPFSGRDHDRVLYGKP